MFKAKMKHFGEDNQFLFLNSVSHLTLFVFDHGSRGHVTVADLSCNVSSRQNLSPNIQSNQGIRPEIFWAEFTPKFLLVLCNDHSTSVFDRTSLVKTRATSDDFSIDQESIISALVAPCETDVVISFIVGNSNTYLTRLFKSLWTHCPSPPVPALCFHFKFRIPFDFTTEKPIQCDIYLK